MNSYLSYMVPLMIALLCLVVIPPCVCNDSFVLGSERDPDTYNQYLSPPELAACQAIADAVTNDSSIAGCNVYPWYGQQTTSDNILQAATGYNPQSILFYVGHGFDYYELHMVGLEPYYEQQWSIWDENMNGVFDNNIYDCTSGQTYQFVFLWSCEQGDTIGGWHWSGYP